MIKLEKIVFDSKNWDSIEDTLNKLKSIGEMQFGETESGESIIFDVDKDEEDKYSLVVSVFQKNGWVRTNIYHVADRTIEEIYRREI